MPVNLHSEAGFGKGKLGIVVAGTMHLVFSNPRMIPEIEI